MLYIIVATLNGLPYTQRLIAALTQVAIPIRLVIVDNGSTDGTLDWLTSLRTKIDDREVPLVPMTIEVLANTQNLGVSTAWNQGIKFALANNAESILICGNDTIPMPGTIERLHDALERGASFVTGTAVPYDEGEVVVALAQDHEPLLDAPDFSFFMFSRHAVDVVAQWDLSIDIGRQVQARADGAQLPLVMNPWDYGLFDTRYFPAYFEDNDYHTRSRFAGLRCLRDPGAPFRHEVSQTIRSNPEIAALNEQTFARNAELFKAKWGKLPHELEVQNARPLNCSEEQWQAATGGRPVHEIDRAEAARQAADVYQRYGLTEQRPQPA